MVERKNSIPKIPEILIFENFSLNIYTYGMSFFLPHIFWS